MDGGDCANTTAATATATTNTAPKYYLFNITEDPREANDLSASAPDVMKHMLVCLPV